MASYCRIVTFDVSRFYHETNKNMKEAEKKSTLEKILDTIKALLDQVSISETARGFVSAEYDRVRNILDLYI